MKSLSKLEQLEIHMRLNMPAIAQRENAACRERWDATTFYNWQNRKLPNPPHVIGERKRAMLDHLIKHGPQNREQLADATGLALNTVADYARDMEAQGFIIITRQKGTHGRICMTYSATERAVE